MRGVRALLIAASCTALVALSLAAHRSFALLVPTGTSMTPNITSNDLVILRKGGDHGVGDVVAYKSELTGQTVLHRIVSGDPTSWTTQGDANGWADPERPASGEIMGEAWLQIPMGGKVVRTLLRPTTAGVVLGLLTLWALMPRSRKLEEGEVDDEPAGAASTWSWRRPEPTHAHPLVYTSGGESKRGGKAAAALLVVVAALVAQTEPCGAENNTVVGGSISVYTAPVTIDDLKPPACQNMRLTNLVTGQGTLTGTRSADLILGSSLDDTVDGGRGNDCILTGAGDDDIDGGQGNDYCDAGTGNDTLLSC